MFIKASLEETCWKKIRNSGFLSEENSKILEIDVGLEVSVGFEISRGSRDIVVLGAISLGKNGLEISIGFEIFRGSRDTAVLGAVSFGEN